MRTGVSLCGGNILKMYPPWTEEGWRSRYASTSSSDVKPNICVEFVGDFVGELVGELVLKRHASTTSSHGVNPCTLIVGRALLDASLHQVKNITKKIY